MALAGIAFDAFGTLFDLQALRGRTRQVAGEGGDELFDAFVARLLPLTWHATVAGHYLPLPQIAVLAIGSAARELGLGLDEADAEDIAAGLASLPAYPDADAALDELRGTPLAILSNGTRAGIESLVEGARLTGVFDHLLVADDVRRFKPATEVYSLATTAFGSAAGSIVLVSGNEWDVAGAKLAGLRAAWISHGRPATGFLGVEADVVCERLSDLPGALRNLR